ncbi:exo-alpha-sialidase [Bacillus sp. AGMB 02131]|uniref:Exo-alpha-sialidase n=1 Tax=Peribacillus faecalis TaxID=2772559 RepID=A0A927CX33_9BACI|nr:sialidase family protein [Peribacillus faecalis]MBD3108342.1 exo-alpha-sialidase [Peribacillus faecalis]
MSRRTKKIGILLFLLIILISASYFGYYKYEQSKITYKKAEGFSISVRTENITLVGVKWLDAYLAQYQQEFVPGNIKIEDYEIKEIAVLDEENNVIQVDFSIKPKSDEPNYLETDSQLAAEMEADSIISHQWVLSFNTRAGANDEIIYEVYKIQRPAGYDLEQYNTNGQREIDEYEQEYIEEIPYKEEQYTYKIENETCFVSYDYGETWIEVPVDLKTLATVGDGNSYYNALQEGSYLIRPEKTSFVYGGTQETGLKIIYTDDQGTTWQTADIDNEMQSVRVKFCNFPTEEVGYVIAAGGRTMSQEGQVIYKTSDGGETWNVTGYGPSTWLLSSGGFIDPNVGFMSYKKVEGEETNFYRTEDGGKTFSPIILPIKEEWNNVFVDPQTPYKENEMLVLLVGQGDEGDYQGGRIMAKYQSEDMGITWEYVELVNPPSTEEG